MTKEMYQTYKDSYSITYKEALDMLDLMTDDFQDWWDDPLNIDLANIIAKQMYEMLAAGDDISGSPVADMLDLYDRLSYYASINESYSHLFVIYSDVVDTFIHSYLLKDSKTDVVKGWNTPHE